MQHCTILDLFYVLRNDENSRVKIPPSQKHVTEFTFTHIDFPQSSPVLRMRILFWLFKKQNVYKKALPSPRHQYHSSSTRTVLGRLSGIQGSLFSQTYLIKLVINVTDI
jgi:hypothetical protein